MTDSSDEPGDVDRNYGMDVGEGSSHFANLLEYNVVQVKILETRKKSDKEDG
jgi:hypothetical protein